MTDTTLILGRASADTASGDQSWLTSLADWTVSLMEVIGPVGAGIAIALENLFPPLPSEVVLPMAGLTASRGSFTLFEALLWTTLGSVIGAFALYGLGRWLGAERLRAIAAKIPLLHPEDIDRTVAWFQRHGGKAVFFGRMVAFRAPDRCRKPHLEHDLRVGRVPPRRELACHRAVRRHPPVRRDRGRGRGDRLVPVLAHPCAPRVTSRRVSAAVAR
jgi:membrane protein YqaA with SNARE-associated domain